MHTKNSLKHLQNMDILKRMHFKKRTLHLLFSHELLEVLYYMFLACMLYQKYFQRLSKD